MSVTEQEPQTIETLSAELRKWERAKIAAITIVAIGLSLLAASIVIELKSEQPHATMGYSMAGLGFLIVLAQVGAIEFGMRGDPAIRQAVNLGAKIHEGPFRRISKPDLT